MFKLPGVIAGMLCVISFAQIANAQESTVSNSSSESFQQSGVMGIRNSNKFAPKYKERIETYKEQIQMGLSRGWLKK